MVEIKTEIEINANIEKIWRLLTNFEKYPDWNPFIKNISGKKQIGEKLKVSVKPPKGEGMTFKPKVISFDENKEFRWLGKFLFSGLFDGEHYFILQKINDKNTRFIHGENFDGILVKLFVKSLEKTKAGFKLMNQALKMECEKR